MVCDEIQWLANKEHIPLHMNGYGGHAFTWHSSIPIQIIIFIDMARWQWLEITHFMVYLANIGRKSITTQKTPKKPISNK